VVAIKPTITIDGNFSDWIGSEQIDHGDVPGYSLYAEAQSGFLHFDLNGPGRRDARAQYHDLA
jgi:hypothetical protein